GSVVALGGNALNITANDHVVLRNLEIRPFPGHDEYIGIRKTGGGALDIERCHMAGFGFETSRAIEIAASGLVTIRDCTISSTWWGVHVNAANAKVVVSDSAFTTMFDKGIYAHAGETTVSNVTMSTPIGAIHLNVVGGAKLFVVDSRLDCADRGD